MLGVTPDEDSRHEASDVGSSKRWQDPRPIEMPKVTPVHRVLDLLHSLLQSTGSHVVCGYGKQERTVRSEVSP